jgi:hypothetical protein
MTYLEAIIKVLIVGLVLGAGLPAVFAAGMVAFSSGAGGEHPDGTVTAPNPVLKYVGLLLFALVSAVILIAILWITRTTIVHHFGVDPFPFIPKK